MLWQSNSRFNVFLHVMKHKGYIYMYIYLYYSWLLWLLLDTKRKPRWTNRGEWVLIPTLSRSQDNYGQVPFSFCDLHSNRSSLTHCSSLQKPYQNTCHKHNSVPQNVNSIKNTLVSEIYLPWAEVRTTLGKNYNLKSTRDSLHMRWNTHQIGLALAVSNGNPPS